MGCDVGEYGFHSVLDNKRTDGVAKLFWLMTCLGKYMIFQIYQFTNIFKKTIMLSFWKPG